MKSKALNSLKSYQPRCHYVTALEHINDSEAAWKSDARERTTAQAHITREQSQLFIEVFLDSQEQVRPQNTRSVDCL